MMGDQNDQQRRCFCSFMVGFRRRGMTRMTAVGPLDTQFSGALDSAFDVGAVMGFQSPTRVASLLNPFDDGHVRSGDEEGVGNAGTHPAAVVDANLLA